MKFSDDQIQQLREVVRSEVKSELKSTLKSTVQSELKKSLAPIKRDIKSIKKDLNWVIGKYDTRLMSLEQHTAHPPRQIDFSTII